MTPTDPRKRPIDPARTALLVIDVQNATFHDGLSGTEPYFHGRARDTSIPNIATLLAAARRCGIECIYTVMESLTLDGRDRSLDYKLSGFNIPRGSADAAVVAAVAPCGDEIVLPKSSSSLFNSTMFDYVLRNLGIDTVLVTGFLTDQCVDHTLRDGADRGYIMVCIEDACATKSPERHANALAAFAGYCRLASTTEICSELAGLAKARAESD
ncbi:MAG: cysteine hydrolase [Rhizobiaceae bacterium]|nr:cysteine hydrolase [Rhizobiaceae bacterium]